MVADWKRFGRTDTCSLAEGLHEDTPSSTMSHQRVEMKHARLTHPGIRLLAAGPVVWWLGITWAVPTIIRATHEGKLPLLGRWMPGRGTKPVDGYLAAWGPIARGSMVVVLTASLVLIVSLLLWQHARRRSAGDADPRPATEGELLIIAAWIGIVTGLGEAYYIVLRVFYQQQAVPQFPNASQHAVWMSPLANLLAFALVGLILVVLRRVAKRRLEPGTLVMALTWLGLFALAMTTNRLHWAAAGVLALGIAIQIGRTVSPGAGEIARLARRSIGWLVALVAALGLGVPALELLR